MEELQYYTLNRSFEARVIQAKRVVKQRYEHIKNRLLSYKGVKSRISWQYDAFRKGRQAVALVLIKGKTLNIYLALDPKEYADSKFRFEDASEIKKYEDTPMRIKVRNDLNESLALEAIDELMKKLGLELGEELNDHYVGKKETDEELLERGLIKKIASDKPVSALFDADEEDDEEDEGEGDEDEEDEEDEEEVEEAPAEEPAPVEEEKVEEPAPAQEPAKEEEKPAEEEEKPAEEEAPAEEPAPQEEEKEEEVAPAQEPAKEEEKPAEEPKEEPKKEEAKPEPKKEEKKAAPKKEAPKKEEKKPAPKPQPKKEAPAKPVESRPNPPKNKKYINVSDINHDFNDGDLVNIRACKEKKLIHWAVKTLRVLGNGNLEKKVTVEANHASDCAKEKIKAAGGSYKDVR